MSRNSLVSVMNILPFLFAPGEFEQTPVRLQQPASQPERGVQSEGSAGGAVGDLRALPLLPPVPPAGFR